MIIGRDTLINMGVITDFKNRLRSWNYTRVEMKDPKLLDNKRNLSSMDLQDEPGHCQTALNRVTNIQT